MSKDNRNPFQSFWMAGYECTDKLNAFGHRVDFLNLTGHIDCLDQDYSLLKPYQITTVREGIRWSQVEKRPYCYDWSVVGLMIEKGRTMGIQQIWDLCHFGFPDDLTPLHPMFARRFASLCSAFVQFYRSIDPDGELIIIPINEVSFLSWLGGDARGTSPYCVGMGWEVKYSLMRAYIEGVSALKEIDPSVRILTAEPLVNVVPPEEAGEEEIRRAAETHEDQFQSVDILCGKICPELGGQPEYLDLLGYNFYFNNQWVVGTQRFLPWVNIPFDPRWRSLGNLLTEAYSRYRRPFLITETGHSHEHRPNWVEYISKECAELISQKLPLWGVCLYPIIDRPDWDHLTPWHASGMWDATFNPEGPPGRRLHEPMAEALLVAQQLTGNAIANLL